jgi:hypothetical protein
MFGTDPSRAADAARPQSSWGAEAFCAGLDEPMPRPRMSPEEAERYAEEFCAGLDEPSSREAEPAWGATGGDSAAPVPPSPELAALQAAIAAVAAVNPTSLEPPQALADTSALLTELDALRVAVLSRVADVEARRLHRQDGAATTNAWLRQQDGGLTAADVTLARRLPSLPTVASAVADKHISSTAAGKIAAKLAKLRRWVDRPDGLIDGQPAEQALEGVIFYGVREQVLQYLGGVADDDPRLHTLIADLQDILDRPVSELARLEAAFVLLARNVEDALLGSALAVLVDALLPNELERRARDAHDRRGFGMVLDPDGDGWHITDGDLDLELGELLHTVLTAMLATDPEAVTDADAYRAARADGWTDADGDEALHGPTLPAPRSLRQRRHDALKLALRLLLDNGLLGSRDKAAPHIAVTVGHDSLHGAPGATPAIAGSGARIPRSLIRQWWCDSAVSRFVLSLGRKVIETSHTERTLKAHERRAKLIETGGRCQIAGCRCGPDAKLIPHHPDAWARTHSTCKDDTVLACEADHHHIHTGATVRLRDGRLLNDNGWVQE